MFRAAVLVATFRAAVLVAKLRAAMCLATEFAAAAFLVMKAVGGWGGPEGSFAR